MFNVHFEAEKQLASPSAGASLSKRLLGELNKIYLQLN